MGRLYRRTPANLGPFAVLLVEGPESSVGFGIVNHVAALGMQVVAQPRVFALLLGSGVSRAAQIPTGYEVELDLIRRFARAQQKDPEPDPEAWFRENSGEPSDYGNLLNSLAPTPAARQSLLKQYFEPNDGNEGARMPTRAHRSIARLVQDGFISIIVTTNFDRLMERALDDQGVVPIVISTPADLVGAPPLQHMTCGIVKVHGDYIDLNIRNTESELSAYEPEMDGLLDRIFDEYGLIIAGWSANYDKALRTAIERRKGRRYPFYWLVNAPNEFQSKLIGNQGAIAIERPSADDFFSEVERAVEGAKGPALRVEGRLEPENVVASLKSLLVDETRRIELADLIRGQTNALLEGMADERFATEGDDVENPSPQAVADRMLAYEALAQPCVSIAATCGYWARGDQDDLTVDMIRQVANAPTKNSGYTTWVELQRYPGMVLLYCAGIAAVFAKKESLLLRLWSIEVRDLDGNVPAARGLNPWKVIDHTLAKSLPTMPGQRLIAPLSEYLFAALREPLSSIIPAEFDYEKAFDRFEYLSALIQADLGARDRERPFNRWYYIGRFGWKMDRGRDQVVSSVDSELESQEEDWPLLRNGLFEGDLVKLRQVKAEVDDQAARIGMGH